MQVYQKIVMDDLRIWNRSRSGEEIRRDMHRDLNGNVSLLSTLSSV
jgi:hypothetical protein